MSESEKGKSRKQDDKLLVDNYMNIYVAHIKHEKIVVEINNLFISFLRPDHCTEGGRRAYFRIPSHICVCLARKETEETFTRGWTDITSTGTVLFQRFLLLFFPLFAVFACLSSTRHAFRVKLRIGSSLCCACLLLESKKYKNEVKKVFIFPAKPKKNVACHGVNRAVGSERFSIKHS